MYKKLLQLKTFLLVALLAMVGTGSALADDVFEKVTSSSQVAAGKTIIIVCEGNNQAMNSSFAGVNVTITNSTITLTSSSTVAQFTVGGSAGAYTLTSSDNKQLSWAKNSFAWGNTTASGNLFSVSSDGTLTSNCTTDNTRQNIRHNTNSTNKFGCYTTSTGKATQIYVKKEEVQLVSPELTISDLTLDMYETGKITYSSKSSGAITFTSSDDDIATFSYRNGTDYYFYGGKAGSATITATQAKSGSYDEATAKFTIKVAGVNAPTFSVTETTVTKGTKVTIFHDEGTQVLYTTDGKTPSYANSVGDFYNDEEITINETTTIKAIAVDNNEVESDVAEITYTVAKLDPALSFSTEKTKGRMGEAFAKKPTLSKANDAVTVAWKSSEESVAKVDGEGNVTFVAPGTTIITATNTNLEDFNEGSATYTLKVIAAYEEGVLFYETFDDCNDEGGNDGQFTNVLSSPRDLNDYTTDELWTTKSYAYEAVTSMKLGKTSDAGEAVTASIPLTGSALLTFRAAGWGGNTTNTFTISATGATLKETVTLPNATWKEYSFFITDATGSVTLSFKGNRGFFDYIKVQKVDVVAPTISLEEGLYDETQAVEITSPYADHIYYTLDGTTPTSASNEYTEPLQLSKTATVKAVAVKGEAVSEVVSAEYRFVLKPTFSPDAGTLTGTQVITITSPTENAKIVYTTDGSKPTVEGTQYGNNTKVIISSSCTLKAIAVVGEDASSVVTAAYTINSGTPTGNSSYYFEKVTDASTLAAGDVVIIVNEAAGKAICTTQKNNNRDGKDVTIDTDNHKISEISSEIQVITLEGETGDWYFNVGGGYLYAASSSNNYMKTQSTTNANAKATIEIGTNGNATIRFQGTNNHNLLQYNSSNTLFSCYSTAQQAVQLYKKIVETDEPTEIAFTISSAGYTTFFSDKQYKMPEGATGILVTYSDGSLKREERFTEETTVPANTALLIKGDAGTYSATIEEATEEAVSSADNHLRGSVEAALTTGEDENEEYEFFGLSYDAATLSKLGFYWLADEGGAFTNGAGKAYLAIPKSELTGTGVRGFSFSDMETITSILLDESAQISQSAFTLSGLRVRTDARNLPKGVYIINGKKVVK